MTRVRRASFAVVAILTLALAAPVSAATYNVSVRDFAFSPTTITVAQGSYVKWTFFDSVEHTATRSGVGGWNSGLRNDGEAYQRLFKAAGSFSYLCTPHASMTGVVRVPIILSRTSGYTTTTYSVTVASTVAPTGYHYLIQRKLGSGSWTTLKSTDARTTSFRLTTRGTWYVRSTLRRDGSSSTSGLPFSLSRAITVR